MHFIIKLMLTSLAVLVSAEIIPGIDVVDMKSAIIVAAVLAFLNAVVKPIMIVLTIPITILTFGLFLIVINGLLILFTDYLVDGFTVSGFLPALVFSLVLAIVNSVFEALVRDRNKDRDH